MTIDFLPRRVAAVRRTAGAFASALCLFTIVTSAGAQAPDRSAQMAAAREAAKAGDAAKCREIALEIITAAPDSIAARFDLAQLAEARKDPSLAFAHYAEIVNFADRAAKSKEKLSDEDAKVVKEAAAKCKTTQDQFGPALARSLRTYADSMLKVARFAKTQKNWKFTSELARVVKDLFDNSPGILEPKDPREVEAGKLYSDAMARKSEDKAENDKQRAEVSEAVAALARDLGKLYDQAFIIYEEVRGPQARRRALLPVSILVSLNNDPDGNAKKAGDLWSRALELEPVCEVKLRMATDSARFTFMVNGQKVASAKNTKDLAEFRSESEYTVHLFRELNFVTFYGHEIRDNGRRGGRSEYVSRAWFLADFVISEKDHVTTDATWQSLSQPPSGWECCPFGCYDLFPVTVIGGTDMWDYEKTKEWKGATLLGDKVDTCLRKSFDLPAGTAVAVKGGAAPATPK